MREYQKIGNIFKFDEKYHTIVGTNEPYETLSGIIWQGTEKIDGTNIRVHWDGHHIEIAGRTDKAEIPQPLMKYLSSVFLTNESEYVFEQMFGEKETFIFGEGFGCGIQKNGADYVENGKDARFIIFDVNINGYDLDRENVDSIANTLGLPSVPVVFEGTLDEAKAFVSSRPMSKLNGGKHEMEGLVLVPKFIKLYDEHHHMIKCKCKYRDMLKSGLAVEPKEEK